MAEKKCIIITIDGPSASGKSTLARELAHLPGFTYLNTGAMYRASAVQAIREGIDPADESQAEKLIKDFRIKFTPSTPDSPEKIYLDGEDITDLISTAEVSSVSSIFSRHRCVREAMVKLQREFAEESCTNKVTSQPGAAIKGIVVEGRDIGTVVFPNADLKIFLTASAEERTRRRLLDLKLPKSEFVKVLEDIEARDKRDIERTQSPLFPASDAVHINNSELTIEETVEIIMDILGGRIG